MKEIDSESLSELMQTIPHAGNVAIAIHVHPDGDALGSAVGLKHFIEENYAGTVRILVSDRYSDSLSFIIKGKDVEQTLSYDRQADEISTYLASCDTLFCLDLNTLDRTGDLKDLVSSFPGKKILIDHHLNPQREEFDLCFSETEISSASEYLYHILKATGKNIPFASLEGIMAGITTDTNNFANSVFPSTLRVCSEIIAEGVDRDAIVNHIFNEYRENRIRLMGHVLKDLLVTTPDGLAYIILDRKTCAEYGITEGELEGFVNLPLAIKEVKMSLFLREEAGFYRVSIRSKKGTSANRCATDHFNGGGHEQAAGGRLYWPKNIADKSGAAEYIEKVTKSYLNES